MTLEIPKEKWSEFFDDLTRRRFAWETKIEVLSPSIGDQILSEGLPLNGITYKEKDGAGKLEISVGETADQHQTHNITAPTKVAFLSEDRFHDGVLEIEDESEVKTLIRIINPMPIHVGYAAYKVVSVS